MVDSAVVDWHEVAAPIGKLEELEVDGDLYAILTAADDGDGWTDPYGLLYIGLAYHQTVEKRIKQIHACYRSLSMYESVPEGHKVIVMVGELAIGAQSVERITEAFVEDVEALLIFVNQPKHNTKHRQSYGGRSLVVTSEGHFEPLRPRVWSSESAMTRWRGNRP